MKIQQRIYELKALGTLYYSPNYRSFGSDVKALLLCYRKVLPMILNIVPASEKSREKCLEPHRAFFPAFYDEIRIISK